MTTTQQAADGRWNITAADGTLAPGRLARHGENESFLIFGTEAAAKDWMEANAETLAEWEAWVAE